jgi:hypothetical protein
MINSFGNKMINSFGNKMINSFGNKMIMLEGIDVCPVAWYTIMGVSKVTYYKWKVSANNGICAEYHGNARTAEPQTHTLQATTTLHLMLEQSTDHMPHKTRTLETIEKVVLKCLLSTW